MKTINKLTKEQAALIPTYINKWIDIASRPMDETKAVDLVHQMYSRMGEEKPLVIIGDSPLTTCLLASLYFSIFKGGKKSSQLGSQLYSQLDSQLDSQLGSQLGSQLSSQLGSQLYSQIDSQLYSQLDSQLGSQLGSQLDSQLHNQLGSQLGSQLSSQLDSQLHNQLGSQLDSQLRSQLHNQLEKINSNWYLSIWWLVWCGWYEFGKMIGVKFYEDKYELFVNFNSEINFLIPYKGICFISRKPTEINWKDKQLHGENKAAVKYADGYSLWALNGVKVPEWLVTTHSDALDPKKILEIENVDQKAEGIRKLGIERLVQYGKVVDSYKNYPSNAWFEKSKYELIDMAKIFKSHKHAYFLKMQNQSVPSVWHLEGVHPDCNTLDKAVRWRLDVKDNSDYQIMEIK